MIKLETDNNMQQFQQPENMAQYQQQVPPQPQFTQAPPQQVLKPNVEYVSSKLAAGEVYKYLKQIKVLCIGAMISLFIINIASVTSWIYSTAVTGALVCAAGYYLYKANIEMNRLQLRYNLNPQNPINKV